MSQIVLVVDDEPAICTFVKAVLQLDGFVVVTAESGPEALNVLSRRMVGVLVTDMTMPDMNGAELAERVKQSWPEVRICYMSAAFAGEIPAGALFIEKPFSRSRLTETVRQALRTADRLPS
jgi:DNA-binding NtrC family response regulator